MRVRGLDGREYKLALRDRQGRLRCSAGHEEARELLRELYPFDPAFEEVTVPGCGVTLYMDFFLPARRLAVEVQGVQHRKAIPFFGGRAALAAQIKRDRLKSEWAELNSVTLVVLHDDKRDSWRDQLLGRDTPGED